MTIILGMTKLRFW